MVWMLLAAMASGAAVFSGWGAPLQRLRTRPDRMPRGSPVSAAHRRTRLLGAAAVSGSALVLSVGVGWWAVPVAVGLGVLSHAILGRLSSGDVARRRSLLVAQLPQACDLLAVCLEAGLPPRRAVQTIAGAIGGPLGVALAEVSAKVGLGADEAVAWSELAAVEPVLAPLAREVARGVGSGLSLSQTLRALGVEARREAASAAEVRAKRVGVRSVLPLMVCFLPSFLLLGVVPIIGGVVQHLLR